MPSLDLMKLDPIGSTVTLGVAWMCSATVLSFGGLKDVDIDR
jgi:hypothetical protein